MTMTPSRRFVTIAFLVVGLCSVLATLFALGRARALEDGANEIVNDMTNSIRLLGQLQHEVDEQRLLIDQHIVAMDRGERATLDTFIGQNQREILATMQAYDRWAILPGERAAWERARAALAAVTQPLGYALALSRQDKDTEARRAMWFLTAQFVAISNTFSELIAINDKAATQNLATISSLRRQLMFTLFGIGLAAAVATFLAGRWAAREVATREADLLRYSSELESRNHDLDAFSGRVAHDIRGPLTVISLATAQLTVTAPEATRATDQLRRGVARIQALTDDLLALAGVGAKGPGTCDPAAVAAQLRDDFAPRIRDQKGALRVAVAHAEVSCSEGLLRQALDNLAENAVKYRRADVAPEVEIAGETTDDTYTLRVTDNGQGMSPEDARQAFTPFYRSPQVRQVPGTGLGLSIVRRVAEAAGGSVSIESRPGRGSTFVIRLRLAGGPGAADASPTS